MEKPHVIISPGTHAYLEGCRVTIDFQSADEAQMFAEFLVWLSDPQNDGAALSVTNQHKEKGIVN